MQNYFQKRLKLQKTFFSLKVDLTALGDLSVKDGFAKYGAKAVFDLSGKLLYIHVCAWNKDVYPPKNGADGLKEWNYAKWVSMATFFTLQ